MLLLLVRSLRKSRRDDFWKVAVGRARLWDWRRYWDKKEFRDRMDSGDMVGVVALEDDGGDSRLCSPDGLLLW